MSLPVERRRGQVREGRRDWEKGVRTSIHDDDSVKVDNGPEAMSDRENFGD